VTHAQRSLVLENAAPDPIIGESAAIRRARALVERFAPTPLPILLVGPTGTGKDLVARHIHRLSRRRGEFVDLNCGALPREMVESLLFGHRRGAFTGAVDSTEGLIERSDQGTLFLDELLNLPVEGQAKLLRVLETGEVRRLSEATKRRIDLRVVSAVQSDVRDCLAGGLFRLDLFHRVSGVVIQLPPLAERPEDILPLAMHFAALQGRTLDTAAAHALSNYSWPGNVRELRLAIERVGWLVDDSTLSAGALVEAIELGAASGPAFGNRSEPSGQTAQQERARLLRVCEENDWDAYCIASALGVHRATLYRRLKRAGLSPPLR